jgi:hypothetical protein
MTDQPWVGGFPSTVVSRVSDSNYASVSPGTDSAPVFKYPLRLF